MRNIKTLFALFAIAFSLTAAPAMAGNSKPKQSQSQSKPKQSQSQSKPKQSQSQSKPKQSISRPKPSFSRPKGSKPKHEVSDTGATLALAMMGFGALALGARKLKK